MRLTRTLFFLSLAFSPVCFSQQWEVGGTGGYAWSLNPSISNPLTPFSAEAGLPGRVAVGAIFGQNMYNYIGGELRYLYRSGGPQLQSLGTTASATGYSNAITYDFMFHMRPRDVRFRPFVSAGAGIQVYTGTGNATLGQPLLGYALLRPCTQVEPAIDLSAGAKWTFRKHVQLRAEFRAYMTPLPNEVLRPTAASAIHGWIFELIPQAGISYVF
jgi:hypothetical protein